MSCLEVTNMIANIATPLALLVVAYAVFVSVKSIKLQRQSFHADLFHRITGNINSITAEQKSCEEKGDDAILNWYQRLINQFEYYAFFANRGYFLPDMETYYKSAVIQYCNWAEGYPEAENFFRSSIGDQLCEVRKYYEKHSGKKFPF